MKCLKCDKKFGILSHKKKFNKQICNKCCETSKYENSIFIGCDCKKQMDIFEVLKEGD